MTSPISNDDVQAVTDILRLLDSAENNDLVRFLESERNELFTFRRRTDQYECAILELRDHLDRIYAVVGGLSALPMSETTREVLKIIGGQTHSNDGHHRSLVQMPMTPPTLGNGSSRSAVSNIAAVINPSPESSPDMRFGVEHLPCAPKTPFVKQTTTDIAGTRFAEKAIQTANADHQHVLSDLQHTIACQRTDIRDLETSLRECRAQELKMFAATPNSTGLRRIESSVVGNNNILAHLHTTDNALPGDQQQQGILMSQRQISSTRVSCDSSISSSTSSASTGINDSQMPYSRRRYALRPSRFVNGWPVYDEEVDKTDYRTTDKDSVIDAMPAASVKDSINIEIETATIPSFSDFPEAPHTHMLMHMHTHTGAVTFRSSVASELNGDGAYNTNTVNVTKMTTPQLFRSVMGKAPRRIYSRLTNRLKKIP
ncbi:hypothetical protein BX661DRAFT_179629 [Kickxella alabastrina]|uniref:uncharacterized protein n=1 Tax=Kickxella alabastrina TaxID=61397 RepID=UPI002220617B|nr:uncharacterized protein BX661DRAFT_179629 [Kickxella alabastrina]KAI7832000.1 hypothetical protein BX661DRAFT_179629 [Kickxella alabastrina]